MKSYAGQLGFVSEGSLHKLISDAIEECLRFRARYEFESQQFDLKILRRQLRTSLKWLRGFRQNLAAMVRSEGCVGLNMYAPTAWQNANKNYAALLSAAHVADSVPEWSTRFEIGRDPGEVASNMARANSLTGAIENIEQSLVATLEQIDSAIPKGHAKYDWKTVNAEQVVLAWLFETIELNEPPEQRLPHGRDRSRQFLAGLLGFIWGGGTTEATREKYVASASRRILKTYTNRFALLSERPTLRDVVTEAQTDRNYIQSQEVWDLSVTRQLRQEDWEERLDQYRQPPRLTSDLEQLARHGSERWPIPLEPQADSHRYPGLGGIIRQR